MRDLLKDMSGILERRMSGEAQLIFLHCGLVGAYIAILLNNAPAYYPNSHDDEIYNWAIFWAFGSFGLGVFAYQQLKAMAESVGEDSVRMDEIGRLLDSIKRLYETAEKAGLENVGDSDLARTLRDFKPDRKAKKLPGLRSMIEVYFLWLASIACAIVSVCKYISALEQMQIPSS